MSADVVSLLDVLNVATTEAVTFAGQLGYSIIVENYVQGLSQDVLQSLTDVVQYVQNHAQPNALNCQDCGNDWPVANRISL